ncbi:Orotate phosphoribosyltransferase [Lunatimonas lonarensis]|uniref:Orotate phosphoribosyltransferase n=1 Tax=Lunatimonas lonarensis TaxID=1232681 RepID=R7ZQG3_9BACT|nr:orotate phosphoribosyltransferase [Lunatimonas lonarensis]EON76293.1 Orotate phosphoribosyltransferase [Lunatimonas lonarensis]
MELEQVNTSEKIAQYLLEINAIRLKPNDPFTWASGWKSPIYCDNRLALSYPKVRSYIKDAIVAVVSEHFAEAEAIAGVATAGIPQGALTADALNLPFLYVRSKPKGHGMENMIEGKVTPGQRVVVIEDLVSTGGSSLKAVEDLRAAGFVVMGMVCIFTYGFDIARENFEKAGVKLISLSDYEHMLPNAVKNAYVSAEDLATLGQWRQDPANWKQ